MEYLLALLRQKVNLALALLIIVIIAIIAAYAISAQAAPRWYFGGQVTYHIPGCTMALPGPNCTGTPCPCPRCRCVAAPCVPPPPKWSETGIKPAGGGKTFSCEPVGYPYFFKPASPPPPRSGYNIFGFGNSAKLPLKIWLAPFIQR